MVTLVFLASTRTSSKEHSTSKKQEPSTFSSKSTAYFVPPVVAEETLTELDSLDHNLLINKANKKFKQTSFKFASARKVSVKPHTHGGWKKVGKNAVWKHKVKSKGAISLNLAFTDFFLPVGGKLILSDDKHSLTFTHADNDDHGQLWTPIFRSDEIKIQAIVPLGLTQQTRLHLTRVNHGFRKFNTPVEKNGAAKSIGDSSSGSCNIDVVCSAEDDSSFGPLIDQYRDQIRSVAAYTIAGTETCTGTLINNTSENARPFFLTANHCGINTSNAPSLVAYWNFDNTTCRRPRNSESASDGDGRIDQFNTGSIFRASNAASDFCLIEFDDPINSEYDLYFAGWDRTLNLPAMTIGIHHPAVSEKRISFDLDPPQFVTSGGSSTTDINGAYLRVIDWDFGTTEGGSSGSALFDQNGRIVGQLLGGEAACGNDLPDWYGKIWHSWTGGGSNSTRLSNWLDETNSGITQLDGRNHVPNQITIESLSIEETDNNKVLNFGISLSEPSNQPVEVIVSTESDTAVAEEDFTPINNEIITFAAGETSKNVNITIIGDAEAEEHEQFFINLQRQSLNARIATPKAEVVILNDDLIIPEINSTLRVSAVNNLEFTYQIGALNTPSEFSISNAPIGMQIDSLSGIITWTPASLGNQSVVITATNSVGSDSETLNIIVQESDLAGGLNLDSENSTTTTGDTPWFFQETTTFDNVAALQSGNISDNQSSELNLEITGPQFLQFRWKADSEQFADEGLCSLNGIQVASISGNSEWETVNVYIPKGSNTLSWRYEKNATISSGEDAIWLDLITLSSEAKPIFESGTYHFTLNGEINIPLEFSHPTDSVSFSTNLPDWLSYDSKTQSLVGIASNEGVFSLTGNASSDGISEEFEISLIVFDTNSNGQFVEQPEISSKASDSFPWTSNSISSNGTTSLTSANLVDNQASEQTFYITGPGTLTFDWMVSSETNYDFLVCTHDGQLIDAISGEVPWSDRSVILKRGVNEISFVYTKDSSVSRRDDLGRIDNFRLTGFAEYLGANGFNHAAVVPQAVNPQTGSSYIEDYAYGNSNSIQLNADNSITLNGRSSSAFLDYVLESNLELESNWTPLLLNPVIVNSESEFTEYRFTPESSADRKAFFRSKAYLKVSNN